MRWKNFFKGLCQEVFLPKTLASYWTIDFHRFLNVKRDCLRKKNFGSQIPLTNNGMAFSYILLENSRQFITQLNFFPSKSSRQIIDFYFLYEPEFCRDMSNMLTAKQEHRQLNGSDVRCWFHRFSVESRDLFVTRLQIYSEIVYRDIHPRGIRTPWHTCVKNVT